MLRPVGDGLSGQTPVPVTKPKRQVSVLGVHFPTDTFTPRSAGRFPTLRLAAAASGRTRQADSGARGPSLGLVGSSASRETLAIRGCASGRSRMIELIAVPFDGMGRDGAQANAPAALHAAGLMRAFGSRVARPIEVELPAASSHRSETSGLLNEAALITMVTRTAVEVEQVLRRHHFPVVYGGDCAVLTRHGAVVGRCRRQYGAARSTRRRLPGTVGGSEPC